METGADGEEMNLTCFFNPLSCATDWFNALPAFQVLIVGLVAGMIVGAILGKWGTGALLAAVAALSILSRKNVSRETTEDDFDPPARPDPNKPLFPTKRRKP